MVRRGDPVCAHLHVCAESHVTGKGGGKTQDFNCVSLVPMLFMKKKKLFSKLNSVVERSQIFTCTWWGTGSV